MVGCISTESEKFMSESREISALFLCGGVVAVGSSSAS